MKKDILETKNIYGVFCNDGTFKIYYRVDIDNKILCLFESNVPKNTVSIEDLGLYNILAIYYPKECKTSRLEKYKSINWLNGGFIGNNGKYYKAVPLDIIMNEFLHIKTNIMYESTADRIEKIMQKKLKDNPSINENIWQNYFVSEINKNDLPERHDKSIMFMEKHSLIEYNNIQIINGMKALSRKYPNIIAVKTDNQNITYTDTVTHERVIDTYDDAQSLINRLYYNSRSGAIVQTYFLKDEIVNYICGIKVDNNLLKDFFNNYRISVGEEIRIFKKKQRIKTTS